MASFDETVLPAADLVWAGLSLPFCPPTQFGRAWSAVRTALRPGGRFAGHFFGPRDAWADDPRLTILDEEAVRELCDGLQVERWHEIDGEVRAAAGPKRAHAFEVIVRRPPQA